MTKCNGTSKASNLKLTILDFSSAVFADDIALLKFAIPWVSLFEAARTVSSVPVNLCICNNQKHANIMEIMLHEKAFRMCLKCIFTCSIQWEQICAS